VIIECVDPVGNVDVVAGKPGRRFDPAGMKTHVGIAFEEREGQHLTGSVGEEVPVGPVPPTERIILDIGLWEEHRADDLDWLQSGGLGDSSAQLVAKRDETGA
jgi:hypothetical protein